MGVVEVEGEEEEEGGRGRECIGVCRGSLVEGMSFTQSHLRRL